MRPQKVKEIDVLKGMLSVFRSKGYDGASLNNLAQASGLKKASLYHRFPNGKQQIASAVLSHINVSIEKNIYDVLVDNAIPPLNRLEQVVKNITKIYDHGKQTCILRALSMDAEIDVFGKQIKTAMQKWIEAFTHLGIAMGKNKKEAQQMAEQTLILIQGSLIVGKGLSKNTVLASSLTTIKLMYNT